MSPKAKVLLVLLSAALNIAFVAGWAVRVMRASAPSPATASAPVSLQQQLDLTPAQWQQVEPLLAKYQQASSLVFAQVDRQRHELLDLLAAPKPDRSRIEEKQREIQAGQQRCQNLVIEHMLAEREILTPAQQQKYFALLREYPLGPMHGGMGRALHEIQGTGQGSAPNGTKQD